MLSAQFVGRKRRANNGKRDGHHTGKRYRGNKNVGFLTQKRVKENKYEQGDDRGNHGLNERTAPVGRDFEVAFGVFLIHSRLPQKLSTSKNDSGYDEHRGKKKRQHAVVDTLNDLSAQARTKE